ncbi:MAG TPA: type II secretion system protein GspG [Blastocatellia bacterium]|nr:type II secretion system protein GspG [Blastocatellia bacterium]
MKAVARALVVVGVAISIIWAAVAADLGSREARKTIAAALGFDDIENVRIKKISPGIGGQATVEATVETAFRLAKDKQGNWKAVEVRTGDQRWESLELIETAVRKEKTLRTRSDLGALATALEAYRRDHGAYVEARTCSALIDRLAPRYLKSIMRLDAWSHEYEYNGTPSSYRLASHGPDGRADSGDEIAFVNGQLVEGGVR